MIPVKMSAKSPNSTVVRRDAIIGWGLIVAFTILVGLWKLPDIPGSGFGPTVAKTETIQTTTGTATQTVTTQYLSGKTFWDLLQLLIVPTVLVWGAYWLNQRARDRESEIADQRRHYEEKIAEDRLQESTLQTYLDQMTELFQQDGFWEADEDSAIRLIARMRTLTTLRRLNGRRNSIIVRFLVQAHLFGEHDSFHLLYDVDLSGADFHGLDLGRVPLNEKKLDGASFLAAQLVAANLSEASLIKSDLRVSNITSARFLNADLTDADLSNAEAAGAIFTNAQLVRANLSSAHLREAILYRANMTGAVLDSAGFQLADLLEANLTDANLSLADFSFAILNGATVTDAQLRTAWALYGARMPDGNRYDGRFFLVGDVNRARQANIDIFDKDAMKQWYSNETH